MNWRLIEKDTLCRPLVSKTCMPLNTRACTEGKAIHAWVCWYTPVIPELTQWGWRLGNQGQLQLYSASETTQAIRDSVSKEENKTAVTGKNICSPCFLLGTGNGDWQCPEEWGQRGQVAPRGALHINSSALALGRCHNSRNANYTLGKECDRRKSILGDASSLRDNEPDCPVFPLHKPLAPFCRENAVEITYFLDGCFVVQPG